MKIDCKEIVRKQLASLKAMGMGALRAKFEELYGFGTKCINQDTVRRRVAYRIQELHLGGLPAETEGELERLADGTRSRGSRTSRRPGCGKAAERNTSVNGRGDAMRSYTGRKANTSWTASSTRPSRPRRSPSPARTGTASSSSG